MNHPSFGELDRTGTRDVNVVWERELEVDGEPVDAHLWIAGDAEPDAARLDAFAALLGRLDALDAAARESLRETLAQDDEFVRFHVEQGVEVEGVTVPPDEDTPLTEASRDAFVDALRLQTVGLWHDATALPVVLDYMLDPERSDEILAVKLEADGRVGAIDWES